jgi:hypothetical protein
VGLGAGSREDRTRSSGPALKSRFPDGLAHEISQGCSDREERDALTLKQFNDAVETRYDYLWKTVAKRFAVPTRCDQAKSVVHGGIVELLEKRGYEKCDADGADSQRIASWALTWLRNSARQWRRVQAGGGTDAIDGHLIGTRTSPLVEGSLQQATLVRRKEVTHRSFRCRFCGTVRRWRLKTARRTRSQIRPFVCPGCKVGIPQGSHAFVGAPAPRRATVPPTNHDVRADVSDSINQCCPEDTRPAVACMCGDCRDVAREDRHAERDHRARGHWLGADGLWHQDEGTARRIVEGWNISRDIATQTFALSERAGVPGAGRTRGADLRAAVSSEDTVPAQRARGGLAIFVRLERERLETHCILRAVLRPLVKRLPRDVQYAVLAKYVFGGEWEEVAHVLRIDRRDLQYRVRGHLNQLAVTLRDYEDLTPTTRVTGLRNQPR